MKRYILSLLFSCGISLYFSQIPGINNQFEWSLSYGVNQNVFVPLNSPYQLFKNNINSQINIDLYYLRRLYKDFYFQLGGQFGGQLFTIKAVFENGNPGTSVEGVRLNRFISPIFNPKLGIKKIFPDNDLAIGFGIGSSLLPLEIIFTGVYSVPVYGSNGELTSHYILLDSPGSVAIPFGFLSIEYQLKMITHNRLLLKFNTDMNFKPRRTGVYSASYLDESGQFYSSQFVFSVGVGFIIATQGSRDKITEN